MRRFLKYLAITQSTSRNGVYLSLPYPENTYHIKIHTKFSDKRKSQLKKTYQTFPTIYIKQEKITRIVKYLFNKFANLAVEPFVLRKPNTGTNVILTIP